MLHLYSVKWGLETYTGDVVVGAYSFLKQSISNLPSEYGGTLTLVRGDFRDHFGGGHSRFGTAYCTRSYRTRLVVPKTEKNNQRPRSLYLLIKEKTAGTSTHNNTKSYINQIYLPRILDTHPLETCRILDISHGRAPEWANSTIFCLVESGRGRPLTNTPPSWFTPLWPVHSHIVRTCFSYSLEFKYSIRVNLQSLFSSLWLVPTGLCVM